MPSISATVKPTPVPRCPERHNPHRAGCPGCRLRSVYIRKLGIWERANGIDRSYLTIDKARDHLQYLTTIGYRKIADIAAESGVTDTTIRLILAGKRSRIYPLTEKSILAVQPAPCAPTGPLRSDQVPAVEGVRILRGLFAQGWSWVTVADQLGGLTPGAAWQIAREGGRTWMIRDTLTRIEAVARELGPHDIADGLLPGMDVRCANRAVKLGWHKLSAWRWLDMADPDADPDQTEPVAYDAPIGDLVGGDPVDESEHDETGLAFVDQLIVKMVTEAAERIKTASPASDGRTGDLYIPKLQLRWLELHAAWWYAENAGLNDTQVAMLLGYDMSDQKSSSFDAGQRQANRIRERMLDALALLDKHPRDWIPAWFNEHPKPAGKPNFGMLLPALLAIQPAPFGRGWTIAQLAAELGATETDVHGFLVYASREGERPWSRRTGSAPKRVRNRPGRCTTTVHATAA
jgi:predicted transcriptional regulator